MERAAHISADRVYRYSLVRRWAPVGPALRWVMLNPSTADAEIDDPTIRRVIEFSRREAYAAAIVYNLYALRSPSPEQLWSHRDPIGPENDWALRAAARGALNDAYRYAQEPKIVVAWGAKAPADRVATVTHDHLAAVPMMCLGRTKDGAPRHPLYVKGDAALQRWR